MARIGAKTMLAAGVVAAAAAGTAGMAVRRYHAVMKEIQRLHDPDLRSQELAAAALSRSGAWILPLLLREMREQPALVSAPAAAAQAPAAAFAVRFEPDRSFDRAFAQTALKIGHDAIPALIGCLDEDNERLVSACAAAVACSLLPVDAPTWNGELPVTLLPTSASLTVTFSGYRVTEVRIDAANPLERPLLALLMALSHIKERPEATRAAAGAMLERPRAKASFAACPAPLSANASTPAGPSLSSTPSGPTAASPR
jgi:hypothetical protein